LGGAPPQVGRRCAGAVQAAARQRGPTEADGIRHPVSGIRHPVSGIWHPVPGIWHPVPGIWHPVSGIHLPPPSLLKKIH
jgi:hypothetical protein